MTRQLQQYGSRLLYAQLPRPQLPLRQGGPPVRRSPEPAGTRSAPSNWQTSLWQVLAVPVCAACMAMQFLCGCMPWAVPA
jgi:hypothetical protein